MFKQLLNLSKVSQEREDGQGLVEYALILVLVSVVVVVILSQMGPAVGNIFSTVVGALNGGVTAEEEEEEEVTCKPYHFSEYMEVPTSNYMPAGRQIWSRGECSDPVSGSAQVGSSSNPRVFAASQAAALAICNNHGSFSNASKPSSYNIWDCS